MRILIAEDDATSRRVLKVTLTKWGYDVISFCDGTEACRVLESGDAPDLVILDWMMPGMDGPEICARLRQSIPPAQNYIILLTTRDRKEDIISGLDAGANDYITKPFDRGELRARVRVGERVVKLQSLLAARVDELQQALTHVKTLQGIIPICMHCHKVRRDQGYWQKLDAYISEHSGATFSHGLCPECLEKYYPELSGDDEDTEPEGSDAAPVPPLEIWAG